MPAADTEIHLKTWRSGSTQAERLAAALLRLENYQNVEPQAPLGGGDGRADILCSKGGYDYVAAVYFPPTEQTFSDVQSKFEHDMQGASTRSRRAFAFFTNQRLTLAQRKTLKARALLAGLESEIYDVERIAGALDEAAGYGLRAAYLRLPMSDAEQIAYFARLEHASGSALDRNTAELRRIARILSRVETQGRVVAQTMATLTGQGDLALDPTGDRWVDPLPLGELTSEPAVAAHSLVLSPDVILFTHRMTGFDLPSRMIGRYRTEEVALVAPGGPPRSVTHHDDISAAIESLCATWASEIQNAESNPEKLAAIAAFHRDFLLVHPFLDGNGRVARALLLQQCLDIFGRADMSRFNRGQAYVEAFQAADNGDLTPLCDLVADVVELDE